ncbi:glycosyltransferase family 39 protein [Cyanobacteria bacterium FACHB-63]|nr:glycosyltransferase family 39 protein [Cyanobacteria bacterium FACHB-63]
MQALETIIQAISSSKRLEIELIFQGFFALFLIGLIPALIIFQFRHQVDRFIRAILLLLASLIILNYVSLVVLYPTWADFADPAEANVAIVSWLFHRGQALYPKSDAAERYINNYGALSYVIQSAFLSILKPRIFSAKIAGCLAGLSSLGLIFWLIRDRLGWKAGIFGSAIVSLCFLAQTSASGLLTSSFWVRPDSLLLFFTVLGLFLVVRGKRSTAMIGSAIALGISTNLKITAFLHFIPIYVLLLYRFGLTSVLISSGTAAFISALPYFIFPQISFTNYWTWLQQVRLKGINSDQIPKNLLWTGFVALPVAIAFIQSLFTNFDSLKRWLSKHFLYCTTLIAGIVVNAVISSTRGALENNMLPFVPLLVYLAIELFQIPTHSKQSKLITPISLSAAIAFTLSLCLAVYSTEVKFINRMTTAPGHDAIADLDRIMARNPNRTIGMGYGAVSYQLSTYRPQLVFSGNPYLLDSASLMEMQASGMNNTPESTLNAMRTCQTEIWLIPKENPPFQVYSYYPPLQKLFSDEFRKIFAAHYNRQSSSKFYDLWVCRTK